MGNSKVTLKLFSFGSVLLFGIFISAQSYAQNSSTQTSIHHLYQSPRPLGMGDAFIAVVNDYNAIFYNPAGLARREDGEINLSLDLSASASFQKFANDVSNAGSGAANDTEKIQAYSNLLQNYYGKQFSLRTGLMEGIWVRPHWGIALLPADFTLDLQVHNVGSPALDVRSYADTTFAYGYGNDIKGVEGRLSWGVTGKFVNRAFASKQVLPVDLALDSNYLKKEDLQEGYTVDADIGILYTPFLPSEGLLSYMRLAKPTFGAVLRNAGNVGFGRSLKAINKLSTAAPEPLYRVLDVGAKFEYPNFSIFSGRGTLDVRDIGHPNFSWRKGFHLGFEFDWAVASWWRGAYRIGVNQGYPTLGVSALFTLFNLDLLTYGEDIGTYSAPKENRMYMLKLNINI